MSGLRMTPQRRAILEALRDRRWHPSADELFRAVRARLPRISLGTVYRNLDLLSREGLLRALDVPGAPRRFDGAVESHTHARCLRCGRVEDLIGGRGPSLREVLEVVGVDPAVASCTGGSTPGGPGTGRSGFRITGHTLELVGICSRCAGAGDVGRNLGLAREAGRDRG